MGTVTPKQQSPPTEVCSSAEMVVTPLIGDGIQGFVATNVLTPHECADSLRHTEEACFLGGRVRGAPDRSSYFSGPLAERLFERLAPLLIDPACPQDCDFTGKSYHPFMPVGVNPQMRVMRYNNTSSDYSAKIVNNVHVQGNQHVGFWTILLYLNDDFEGGETAIYYNEPKEGKKMAYIVKPKVGKVLCVPHFQTYSDLAIRKGTKFVARAESIFAVTGRSKFGTW